MRATAFLLCAAMLATPAAAVNRLLEDRDYAQITAPDPAFDEFFARFAAALQRDDVNEVAALTAFPLPWAQECLDRRAFAAQYRAMFSPLETAVAPHRLLVSSRNHPERYYAWVVPYRDGSEGGEAFYEFERTGGTFRLSRVGTRDTQCPGRSS